MSIVTRFAPSPTGYLHIGGARTALFNWLFARGRGGKFLLRIEDTDRARHNEAAVDAILDGLKWLGLDWDGDPVSQFGNRERHIEIANQLLEAGKAYKCYMTPEELDEARTKARETNTRFESPYRDDNPSSAPDEAPFAIRFKAPTYEDTIIEDIVQGIVKFPNSALDDLIIVRSDGNPTYNLAVVVDDHDMGVTHIVRGDDHLNNAARQKQIYDALGWQVPKFAHVPLIHGSDGAKLSKRHGALGVEAYRDMGYLPEALSNYLIRLGWSHGDEEIIPQEKALGWFSIHAINKAPSRLDFDKLNHINAHYVGALSDDDFIAATAPFLTAENIELSDEEKERLSRSAPFLKTRCATLADIVKTSEYLLLKRPLDITGKAAKPLKKEGAPEMLLAAKTALDDSDLWLTAESLENRLKSLAEEKNVGFGQVGQPLRAALTAGRPSPSLGEVLYGLGRAEVLARLDDQIG